MSMDIFRSDALAGKSILVTGGGSGLGKEISKALVAKGAAVHICGRRVGVLEEAASEIAACGTAPVFSHVCDIRDADHVEAMMEAVWKAGPLTGLVNNAAANFIAPTKDLSPRGFRAITSTVMDGRFHVTLAAGKRWIAEGRKGSVVSNLVTWVLDGLSLRSPVSDGQDRAACDDHVARSGMGSLRNSSQCDGARPVPDRERMGEAQSDPGRQIERDQFGHRADAPIRRNERVAEPHHISALRRLRLSDRPDDSDRWRPASRRPGNLRGFDLPD